MAAKVKGLTLEIDGNTVGLEKGLAKLNKPINAIKNELKDVTRLLKLDPGNTELLAQKQQLLSKQIAESKDKLVALQQAKQQADADMKSGTEVNQEEYRKLCREIKATKQNIDSLTDAYNKSNTAAQKLAAVGDKMQKVGNGISAVGKAVAPVSAAVAGVGGVGLKLAADFEDSSNVARGLTVQFIATGTVTNPSLFEVRSQKGFKIRCQMHAGDVLTVTTGFKNKRIMLKSDGVEKGANNMWVFGSTWLQVEPGSNVFRYDAESGVDNLDVVMSSTPVFWGV